MNERDEYHPSGQEASDSGQSMEMLEGKDTFGEGRVKPVPENEREELLGVQGPGGDSRPDRIDPSDGGFIGIDDDPRMTTTREAHDQPEVRKEDPRFLAEHRVDQEDEIVPRPMGAFNEEGQVLQARTQRGDKEEQL